MMLFSGDRIWVTGNRIGSGINDTSLDNPNGAYSSSSCAYPAINPYTGQTRYIKCNTLKPTKEILAGLGEMYVADERFLKNFDRHGDGTAQFISDAIKAYCK